MKELAEKIKELFPKLFGDIDSEHFAWEYGNGESAASDIRDLYYDAVGLSDTPPSLEEAAMKHLEATGEWRRQLTVVHQDQWEDNAAKILSDFASPYAAKAEMLERELEELKRQTITDGYQQVSKRCDYEKRR